LARRFRQVCTARPPARLQPFVNRAPRIFAYRGTGDHAPNTVPALQAALAEGADGLAVDMGLTRDGVWVAAEDRLVRALGLGPRVGDVDWATLTRLDLGPAFGGQAARVPTIEDLLARFESTTVALCMPGDPDPRLAGALTDWHPGPARAWWIAADEAVLAAAAMADPQALRILRIGHGGPWSMVRNFDGWAAPVALFDHQPPHDTEAIRIGLDCDSVHRVARVRELGLEVVFTERPGWLARRLAPDRPPSRSRARAPA
jgi:hypothetical protein